MYPGYSTTPPMQLIKNQINKYSKRIAIVQSVLMGSLVAIVAMLYSIKEELLVLLEMPTDDLEAMQELLTNIVEANQTVFSFMTFFLLGVLISGIMYLIAFFRLAKRFQLLARILPTITQPALKTGNFIRYALLIQITSIFLTLMMGTSLAYVSQIITAIGYGLLTAAYYNISILFKKLYSQSLYPKKENRLLLYAQILTISSTIPLALSMTDLGSGLEISLIPLIIGGVLFLGGYIGLAIGFYKLSKDIMLVEEPLNASYQNGPDTPFEQTPQRHYEDPNIQVGKSEKIIQEKTVKPTEIVDDQTAIYCSNCGGKLKEGKAFCHHCGMRIDEF